MDLAWLGLAPGSAHYLVIFTTLFPLLTNTFFPHFFVAIPRNGDGLSLSPSFSAKLSVTAN